MGLPFAEIFCVAGDVLHHYTTKVAVLSIVMVSDILNIGLYLVVD